MLNALGKELRKLRIDRNERILDMADKIKKSPAFISAIERGKKSIPATFDDVIIGAYNLTGESAARIRTACSRSRRHFTLFPESDLSKDTVSLMARRMNELSEDQLHSIQKILRNKK